MKKSIRILIPLLLIIAIVGCSVWYLFVYDREFTRDMLLNFARISERNGKHELATWFYDCAYKQADDNEAVAIELAQQYIKAGNYTKAEFTLINAISDGGGVDLYVALSSTYVQQDKLLDAVRMLDSVTNPQVKSDLAKMRPEKPVITPEEGFYSQYISVSATAKTGKLYVCANGEYPSVKDGVYTKPIALSGGATSVYALSIADNGLVSPVCIATFTIGDVIEKLTIQDAAMDACIREVIGASENKQLYTNDLWQITEFTIPEAVLDYSALKHMPFLKSLHIEKGVPSELDKLKHLANLETLTIISTDVAADSLKTIGSMPYLKQLTLRECGLSSIKHLSGAENLEYLDLSFNSIDNVDAIAAMTKLSELYLQSNVISSLAPLSNLNSLKKLDVSKNTLHSVSALSTVESLVWVNAESNQITELGGIGQLPKLETLNLAANQLKSVSVLSGCITLQDLNISNNKLTNISELSSLEKLMYLDFSYNEVSEIPTWSTECALVNIDGSYNKISSLEPLAGLTQLNKVHMDYNTEIRSVDALVSCRRLVEVNVYATKVTNVTALTNQSVIVNYNPTVR